MSGSVPFPGCSVTSAETPNSSHSHQHLLSPTSHYRELFATGRKRRRVWNIPQISVRPCNVQPEPVDQPRLHPAANESRPACRADAATYRYNVAQGSASSDGIIDSDATVDSSDCEHPEDAGDLPSPRQAPRIPKRRLDDFEEDSLPGEETKEWESDVEKEGIHDNKIDPVDDAPLPALNRDISEGLFTTRDWATNVIMETSPPLSKSDDESSEPEFIVENHSRGRQPSVQLGTTPRSVRHEDRESSHPVFPDTGLDGEEPGLPVMSPALGVRSRQGTGNWLDEIEESLAEARQSASPPELPASDEPMQPIVFIRRDRSASREEEEEEEDDDDADEQFTISDAILDMHQLMGQSFWADDEQWLANILLPVPRSQPSTPYSNEIIKTATRLIEIIDCIKAKESHSEQARCAAALEYRIGGLITKIQNTGATIWDHLFSRSQQQGFLYKPQIHPETVQRMRRYVIPRLVVVLSTVFTLLCNPRPEIRHLVLSVTEQICYDTERIAKIIDIGTEKEEDGEGKGAEVEEFMHSLAVVRDWAKAERDAPNGEGASRYIAL